MSSGAIPGTCNCTCPCNCPVETGDFKGGVVVGGSVCVSQSGIVYEDMAVWPLNESAPSYLDRGEFSLHGTATSPPQRVAGGVYCQWAQSFDGRQWIEIPGDPIDESQPFAMSMWVYIDSFYKQRQWYSRGFNTIEGDQWVFTLGHSVANTVWARVHVPGEEISVFGNTTLDEGTWYHVGCVIVPGDSIKVYVNGVLDGSVELSAAVTVQHTNGNFIGRFNDAASPEGRMQEIRLHFLERDAAWMRAEYDNYCESGFYTVSGHTTNI